MSYYADLGVAKDANAAQIAEAYRALSLRWHPKLAKEDLNTSYKNFCKVSEAFEVLSDNEKRQIYDKFGEAKLKEGFFYQDKFTGGYRFSGNPQQIFEKFFGSKNPYEPLFDKHSNKEAKSIFSTLYPQAEIEKLKDLVVEVKCNLTEIYNGCRKQVSYTKQILNKDGRTTSQVIQTKEITIKPGTKDSQKTVYNNQGHERAGIVSSDLIFMIKVQNEKGFKRDGDNLIYTANISLLDALESKPFTITTLDGRILNLAFDEIINPQTKRIVKGEGLPICDKQGRGDLQVKFDIQFPSELTEDQKRELNEILAQ